MGIPSLGVAPVPELGAGCYGRIAAPGVAELQPVPYHGTVAKRSHSEAVAGHRGQAQAVRHTVIVPPVVGNFGGRNSPQGGWPQGADTQGV